MPRFQTGIVLEVLTKREGVLRLRVERGGVTMEATAFTAVTGDVAPGDRVILNTTGIDLDLGTGGEDFVLWNLEHADAGVMSGGHILKMRYTPWQIDTLAAEAPESPHHSAMSEATSLDGMPVVACGLHSQVAPVAAVLRSRLPGARIAFLMTDGAALPIAHSNLVAALSEKGLLDLTVTCGHAFGGDLECVNVYSGLVAAHRVGKCHVTVVSMGPGVVGTGTVLGHTEMEQGTTLAAARALGGRGIAAVRISFAEERERHRVVSHHSITALTFADQGRSLVAIPLLPEEKMQAVLSRLAAAGITERHQVMVVDASEVAGALSDAGIEPVTMGRGLTDDPEFFQAAGAAGIVAAQLVGPRN